MSKKTTHRKKGGAGGGAAAYREKLERVFYDTPIPENVDNEDEVIRLMTNRLEQFRKVPMTETEIAEGQQAVLEFATSRGPTRTKPDEHAQGVDAPFIIHCGRIADAISTAHYKPGRTSNRLIQSNVFKPTSALVESLLYTTGEAVFAPIRFMLESGRVPSPAIVTAQAQITRSAAGVAHYMSVQRFVALFESMTGLGLEGGVAAREQGVLCLVFDHIDTAQFAALVALRFDKSLIPVASMDAKSVYGNEFPYELFDAPYLTRDGTPWANLHAGFVDAFYFDRVEAPYGRLVADTRNV
jgi:hypothetical protein